MPIFLSLLQKEAHGNSPSGVDSDSSFCVESRKHVVAGASETCPVPVPSSGSAHVPTDARMATSDCGASSSPTSPSSGERRSSATKRPSGTPRSNSLPKPAAAAASAPSSSSSPSSSRLYKSCRERVWRVLGLVFERFDDAGNPVSPRTRVEQRNASLVEVEPHHANAITPPCSSLGHDDCEEDAHDDASPEGSESSFSRQDFYSKYEVLNPSIGRGSTSSVMEIRKKIPHQDRADEGHESRSSEAPSPSSNATTTRNYACKVIKMSGADGGGGSNNDQLVTTTPEMIMMELRVMRSLRSHPSILTLHDVVWSETTKECFIVTELAKGGTLAHALKRRGRLEEAVAREVMLQVLEGVAFMHRFGLAHRDLKLENIFLLEPDDFSQGNVQVADFGLSKLVAGSRGAAGPKSSHSICGSPLYIAPEMLYFYKVDPDNSGKNLAKYGLKIDMWACGIVLYQLLSGRDPFTHTNGLHSLFAAIKAGEYSVSSYEWSHVSREARDLVLCLLQVDPKRRLTADEALQHPWMGMDQRFSYKSRMTL